MPRVDADLKLDFKDVLLRPKRSSLKSRSEVRSVDCVRGKSVKVEFKAWENGSADLAEVKLTQQGFI